MPELLNGRDQCVDLHCATALEVLQHRGLMRADAARAIDTPLDIDPEMHTETFSDRLCFEHHRARHCASAGIAADDVERAAGQRADRVEAEIAPQLQPDLVAYPLVDRRIEPGRRQDLGSPLYAP